MGQYQQSLQALPRLWLELLAVTGLAILVLAMMAQRHSMTTIVQTVSLFAAAAFRLAPAANRMLNSLQSLLYGVAVINALYEEFCLPMRRPAAPKHPRHAFSREIELADVSYTYPGADAPALDRLSLSIRKGECIGFIGHSGSGKTTLVDVVLGLLTPSTGRVLVDGQDIFDDLRGWQDQVGYVPQSIYLVDSSLRSNVAFGLPDAMIDDAAVARAIRAAQLDEFVASLPDGLDTVVGERGVRISGGQRQRIGIARALYHDPVVVVLDEATSSLDTATERGIMDAVGALRSTKTVIIVAHRLSTVAACIGSPAAACSNRAVRTRCCQAPTMRFRCGRHCS
jgi:ABC-type multidrug transport system fused ATPase/permease subunit